MLKWWTVVRTQIKTFSGLSGTLYSSKKAVLLAHRGPEDTNALQMYYCFAGPNVPEHYCGA